jgi:hypothetical protein
MLRHQSPADPRCGATLTVDLHRSIRLALVEVNNPTLKLEHGRREIRALGLEEYLFGNAALTIMLFNEQ